MNPREIVPGAAYVMTWRNPGWPRHVVVTQVDSGSDLVTIEPDGSGLAPAGQRRVRLSEFALCVDRLKARPVVEGFAAWLDSLKEIAFLMGAPELVGPAEDHRPAYDRGDTRADEWRWLCDGLDEPLYRGQRPHTR